MAACSLELATVSGLSLSASTPGQPYSTALRTASGNPISAASLPPKSGVIVRAERLGWLGGETMVVEGQCHVLSNARCLTGGIDVPALDAVLFLQPRKSHRRAWLEYRAKPNATTKLDAVITAIRLGLL